ncbi:MAG: hypothetical protein R2828_09555 [Saprospiraceae bacterium]
MKNFAITMLLTIIVLISINKALSQVVPVYNWYHPVEKDWVTIVGENDMSAAGYNLKTLLYYGSSTKQQGMVAIYRWYHSQEQDWVTLSETYGTDESLKKFGYTLKTFLFYAYPTQKGGTVRVNLWYHAGEKDYVALPVDHGTEESLIQWGYVKNANGVFYAFPKNTGTTITLTDIDEWLCPKDLLRGDREFGGHGPRVKCEVTLKIGDAGRALYADIYFWAQETTSDWSTTERRWSKKVYDAPYGKTITAINSDKASRTQFVSPAAGFQFLVPGNDVASVVNSFLDGVGGTISSAVLASFGIPPGDFQAVARLITGVINNGNTVVRVPAIEGTLVKFFHIVGDTGGPDISDDDNCNDDTRIVKLEFNPVKVTLQ